MRTNRIAFLTAAFGAALFFFGDLTRAADGNFPIYFPNSKLVVKSESLNRTTYLPLREIVEFMGLPYTDALALETFTIRSGSSRLVVTKNSALISLNDQIILLPSPILRENQRWLAPIEFLTQGLARLTGTEFHYRPGTSRIFAGDLEAFELIMNAQSLGPITRLAIRSGVPLNLDLRRDNQDNRAILAIDRTPINPVRERLDYKDRLVRSIVFDDADGSPKIILELTNEVMDMKMTATDNNRIFFVDLVRKGATITEAPPPLDTTAIPKLDSTQTAHKVRVIVIDPGHGGMDAGAHNATIVEKDLTLALARKLRMALQTRLGATVLLTRDSDVALDNEARSAVANNNQANLFLSLHVGYSPDSRESDTSIFLMNETFGNAFATASTSRDRLFLPWYLGYRLNRQASGRAAKIFQEEITKAIPQWHSPVRSAPLAVLSSATMPSLLLEIGNLNNPASAQSLSDSGFEARLIGAVVNAVQRFSTTQSSSAN